MFAADRSEAIPDTFTLCSLTEHNHVHWLQRYNYGYVCWIVSDCCLRKDFDRSEVKFSEQKSRF